MGKSRRRRSQGRNEMLMDKGHRGNKLPREKIKTREYSEGKVQQKATHSTARTTFSPSELVINVHTAQPAAFFTVTNDVQQARSCILSSSPVCFPSHAIYRPVLRSNQGPVLWVVSLLPNGFKGYSHSPLSFYGRIKVYSDLLG